MMLRRTLRDLLSSGAALGALLTVSLPAAADDAVTRAWAEGSPVQVFGTAPTNRMPGQGSMSIQLLNDPESGGEVWFLVDGREESLQPGEALDLTGDRVHLVEFNSGGDFGDLRFSLYQGVYKFKVMPEGWGLFKSSQPPVAAGRQPTAASPGLAQPTPAAIESSRMFTPPSPAADLRTRRMASGSAGTVQPGQRAVNPPAKPADSTNRGEDATRSIAAPPAPGVTRERSQPTVAP